MITYNDNLFQVANQACQIPWRTYVNVCLLGKPGELIKNDVLLSYCVALRSLQVRQEPWSGTRLLCKRRPIHAWSVWERKHLSLDISPGRDESVHVTLKVKMFKYRSSSKDMEMEAWETSRAERTDKRPVHTTDAEGIWKPRFRSGSASNFFCLLVYTAFSRDFRDIIVFEKLPFQNVFRPH